MSVDERWEQFLRAKILDLAREPGDWVALADLRPHLDEQGLSRDAQDHHLKRLSKAGKLDLVPESNRKALREPDHDAAVHISGEANHLVRWQPS